MDNLYERLKNRRKKVEMTQQQLAKVVGVSHVTISQWERGDTNPKGSNLHLLAKALGCSAEWLLGISNPPTEDVPSNTKELGINRGYPLISWIEAKRWNQNYKTNPKNAEFFPCPISCSDKTFVLQVQGISMDPIFRDGDLIFIDPVAACRHGSYVVARLENQNEAIFKQLIIESGNKYLKPVNQNWPEQIISMNENCTIIGVVVFSGRSF